MWVSRCPGISVMRHGTSVGALTTIAAVVVLAAVSGPVLAANSEGEAAPAARSPEAAAPADGVEEIIVTAFKRPESSLKVPATIAVLGGSDLKTDGVNNINDVQNLVSGLVIGNGSFGTVVSIRGVTSSDETSKGELGISYNVDGAFVGRGQEQGAAFFDVDHVEVLKGPQGTLYGRSSTGGAINIISRAPVLGEFSGYANLEFGNYNTERTEVALNVPVGDKLALRFAGNSNSREGFLIPVNTTVNGATGSNALSAAGQPAKDDQKDRTGRFSLLYVPNDRLTAKLIDTAGHIGGVGGSAVPFSNLQAGGESAFNVVPNPIPAWVDEGFTNFNGQLNVKFGTAQLDLLGSNQHFTDRSQFTGNGNPYDTGSPTAPGAFLLDQYTGVFNTNQFEVRLSNIDPAFIDYVAGANYYTENIRESDHNWQAPVNTYADYSTWVTAIDPVNTTTHKSYGFFGQGTLHLSDRIGIVGGARYSHDQNGRNGTFAVGVPAAANPTCTYPNDCIGGPNSGTESDSKVTWRAGLNFQASPRDLFYGSVATGFKAGGFNDFDPKTHQAVVPYGPESMTAYEIGYKGQPTPDMTLTSSAYYYDYSKDQINGLTLFVNPGVGVVGVLYTQLAPVEIYGLEGDMHYRFNHDTTGNLGVSYEHSKIKSLETGFLGYLTGTFANWAGFELPTVPAVTVNASIMHSFDLANGAQLRLRAASKFSSSYLLSDYANAVQYRQDAFTRSDASVTYATEGDRLTVQLFVENIENNLQKTAGPNGYNGAYGGFTHSVASPEANGTPFPVGSVNFGVSTPRFYGVRLGVKF